MKKIYKIMVFVMMLALAVGSVLAAPITIFAAGAVLVGATITLTKMPTKATVNAPVTLPKGTASTSMGKPTVVDPLGNVVDAEEITESGANWQFTPKYVGDYKVTYTAEESGSFAETKETFVLHVTGSTATLALKTNTPFMLPSKVGAETTLVLPYPTITVEDEEYVGAYIGEATEEDAQVVSVRVTDPNHQVWTEETTVDDATSPLGTKVLDGKTHYTFKAAKYNEEVVYGTYSISYIYRNSQTGETVSKSYKVNVSQGYTGAENENITFTWDGSLPTSAVLGNEVTLPKPVTVDSSKNSESVGTYTVIDVVYKKSGEEDVKYEVEDFKFTPMHEAKSGSYYELTYKIYSLEQLDLANPENTTLEEALENGTPVTKTYTLANVTDTVAPVPQVVGAYELEEGNVSEAVAEALEGEDVSYLIPSKARTQVEIEIPAIYATDNYAYEGYFKDLTLSRTLVDEDGNTYKLDGEETIGDEDSDLVVTQAKTNEVAKVMFRIGGTYTVRYRATDKANNTKDLSYKMVISDALTDLVKPAITLPSLVEKVNPGEKITFSPATIVDYKTDSSSPETMDTNIKKGVYYYLSNTPVASDADFTDANIALQELKVNEDGVYEIEVPEDTELSYVNVVFRAEDDGKYLGQGDMADWANNVAWSSKAVRIFKVNDEVAPTLETNLEAYVSQFLDGAENRYGQGETVVLDEITFSDKDSSNEYTSEYLTTSLKVYDKNGNQVKVSGMQYTYDNNSVTLANGKFVTTVAGEYQIVITATDLGGNSLINSVRFTVEDTKAPVVELENIPATMELGKTYVLPKPVVYDDGEEIENSTNNIIQFGENNPSANFVKGTMEFTPLEKGTYTFRFVGRDGAGLDAYSNWYSVTVSDTIKPVIKVNETELYTIIETAPYKLTNGVANSIDIPLFTATDEYNGVASTSVKVTNPDGEELAVTTEADHYSFKPTGHGIYTVTYSAVDLAGNNADSYSYTIKVGDVTPPTVTVQESNIPTSYKIGDTISIDLSKITIKDDVSGETTTLEDIKKAVDTSRTDRDLKLKIVLKNADGTTLDWTKEDDIWTYKFTTAGNYTISYLAEDKAGNENSDVLYSFEVKSTSSTSSISEATWGAVLIVISVALLAGVVIFFVKTKDSSTPKDSKKEDKE